MIGTDVLQLTQQALWLVLILTAPPVIVAAAVGILIAFIQAATQLQEQTLQFALKFFAVVVTIFLVSSVEDTEFFSFFANQLILLGVSVTRLAVAFLVLPLFSNQVMPAMIRNSIFVALGVIVLLVHPPISTPGAASIEWLSLFGVEVFIGLAIGIFFGVFLWAFESAGILIDSAIGSTIGQVYDPVSGHEVTLMGELLGRWANYLFMAAGGLLLITGTILESFSIWPIGQSFPELSRISVRLFENELSRFMVLCVMLASPILLVTFLIDLCMGLINRFAPQLNVLFLSMSIKGISALLILILMMATLTTTFFAELDRNAAEALEMVKLLLKP